MTDDFPEVAREEWRKKVEAELKGADFDRVLRPESIEGFAPQPLYTQSDAEQIQEPPGVSPFRRGHKKTGDAGVTWMTTQRQSLPDLDQLEEAILEDQSGGVRGFWLTFDRAGRLGADSSDLEAIEHCGVEGAPISELSQLDQVVGGLDLEHVRIHLDCGANALPAASLMVALAELREIPLASLELRLNADPIAALARDGEIPGELTALIEENARIAEEVRNLMPRARTFVVSTECWQEAGVTTSQEIGIALATGLAYLRSMEGSGMRLEDAIQQIAFRLPMGRDLFVSIAKIRALRWTWNLILGNCGLDDPTPGEIHAICSRRALTKRDPWVNMLRTTTQTMAASIGGAEEITTARYDDMAGPAWWPSSMQEFIERSDPAQSSYERSGWSSSALGRRIARNTQTIVGEESHIGEVADPAGGSYYVESLTDELGRRAWQVLNDIETEGGIVAALRNGTLHAMAADRQGAREGRLRRRRDAVTGVSEFATLIGKDVEGDAKALGDAVEAAAHRLREHCKIRGPLNVAAFEALAEGSQAAAQGATLGELSRAVSGRSEFEMMEPLRRRRDADDFEELRDFADARARQGKRPKIYLATIGSQSEYNARVTFATNMFAAGGIETIVAEEGETDFAKAVEDAGCLGVCICGSDAGYEAGAARIANYLIETLGQDMPVMLAGRPDKLETDLPRTVVGVNMMSDAIQLLGGLLYLSDLEGGAQ